MTVHPASGWQATIPPLSEWQAAYPPLRRAGAELKGPCPLCGGDDRLHVGEKGGRVLFECRVCMEGQPEAVRRRRFRQVLRAVFGDGPANPPGQPRAAPRIDPPEGRQGSGRPAEEAGLCSRLLGSLDRHPARSAAPGLGVGSGTARAGKALPSGSLTSPSPARCGTSRPCPSRDSPTVTVKRPPVPSSWWRSLPQARGYPRGQATPPPQALAVHFIDHDGRGVRRFGGKNKVAWGSKTGAFGLIGNPNA